jgi:hypothetical protein
MEKDFSFLDNLQVIAEEDILDSGLDRERIWLMQTADGTIFGPYLEDELRKVSYEHGRSLNFCNACRLSDRQWKLFFDHPQFQRRVEAPFPPLIPRNQENFEEFYVLHQGQKHGPYAPDAIQQMLIKKVLNMHSLISADKGKAWKKIYHFEMFDRRRDGKFAVPSAVKSQTLNQIKQNSKEQENEPSIRIPAQAAGNLAEEITSTLMLGQKQIGPRSPRSINYQFQKEFRGDETSKIGLIPLSLLGNIAQSLKKQAKGLYTILGLVLLIFVGKKIFPTDPSPMTLSTIEKNSSPNFKKTESSDMLPQKINYQGRDKSLSESPPVRPRVNDLPSTEQSLADPHDNSNDIADDVHEAPDHKKKAIKKFGDVLEEDFADEPAEDSADKEPSKRPASESKDESKADVKDSKDTNDSKDSDGEEDGQESDSN